MFTCYFEIFKFINDWVAELVYFLNFCPVPVRPSVISPLNILPVQCQSVLSVWAIVWPSRDLPRSWLASLRVSLVWPDYCYIAGCPPVDHQQCYVSSPGKIDHNNRQWYNKYCDHLCDLILPQSCDSSNVKLFQTELKGAAFPMKDTLFVETDSFTKFSLSEKIIMFFTLQDSFLILTALFPGWKCRNSWNYSTQVQCQLTFQQLQKLVPAKSCKQCKNLFLLLTPDILTDYIFFWVGKHSLDSFRFYIIFMCRPQSARLIYTSSWNFRILFLYLVET